MVFFNKSSALPKKVISFLLASMMIVPLVLIQTSATVPDTDESLGHSSVVGDESDGQATDTEAAIEDPAEPGEGTDPIEDHAAEDVAGAATYANSISGMLWLDMYDEIDNGIYAGDGIRQQDESPLAGYTVSLFKADDRSNAVREIATGEDGRYEFTGIDTGAYVVGVAPAAIDGIEYLLPFYYLGGTEGDNRFAAIYDAEMDAYLYACTESIEVGGDTVVTDMDAGMRTLPGGSPLIGEIVVDSESEFIDALANAAYTTIYLGSNITMTTTSNSTIVAARTGPLVINGTDPREGGTRHTYTDHNSSTTYNALGGTCTDITFKDITLNIRNFYGIYYADTTAATVTLDNVTGVARQVFYGRGANSTLVVKDSNLTLSNTGQGAAQEFAENAGTVRFEGKVTVTRDSTSSTGNEIFYLMGSSSTVKIEDGADVLLDNSANTLDGDIFFGVTNFTVGEGAKFTCYSASGFCDTGGPLTNVTIGQAADVRFVCVKSHYLSSLYGTANSTFTMEPGSSFLLYDNETDATYSVCYFKNIILNNPKSFIVLNPSARAMGSTYRPILEANDVSSIRYYPSASVFNTSTYAYTPARNAASWWAQSSPFDITANTWPNPSQAVSNYSGGNVPASTATILTSLTTGNFSASANVYGIEIYGTLCTVTYDGNGADSGTAPASDAGVPNDLITLAGNTGGLTRASYTFDGWNTEADGTGTSYSVGETFAITENTTLYAQWVQNKCTVSGTLSGGSVGGLMVSYTMDGGTAQTVTTDSGGNYAISEIPRGSTVIITPPAQTGCTVSPASITLSGISADSTGNNFTYTLNKYAVSGSVSGLADNSGVTVSYTVDGSTKAVTTDSSGNYTIMDAPYGSTVVITPSAQNGYTAAPASITLSGISADSTANNFTYERIYTVMEKYIDESTGIAFQNDTYATLTVPSYSYSGSLDNITADGDVYIYQGYEAGSYSLGDMPDGIGTPTISALTADETVYLIYHRINSAISVTFPTGKDWDFYVDQDTYPNVETGPAGSNGRYYSFENESDQPIYVDLTEMREISSGGLSLVADASASTRGSNEYSLKLLPASIALTGMTNGFTDAVTGITPGIHTAMRLGALDGQYVQQAAPISTKGYITIGGHYAGYLSATEKNPQLTLTFTFSLVS